MTVGAFAEGLMHADRPMPVGLHDGRGKSAQLRYQVYRNNVMSSLISGMEQAFPVVRQMVGDDFFKALAKAFLQQMPPKDPVIAHLGRPFPRFLQHFPPVAQLPYLADVARIENALRESYHAADPMGEVLTEDHLITLSNAELNDLRLKAVPAVLRLQSPFPAATLWLNHQPNAEKKPLIGAEDTLISRPEFDPKVDILPEGGIAFLAELNGRNTLAVALSKAPTSLDTLALLVRRRALLIK